MVPIPRQMLEELRLRADQPVRLVSEGGAIGIEPLHRLRRQMWSSSQRGSSTSIGM
jgi:antitoxin component of MazEF toxin-antitoxin module